MAAQTPPPASPPPPAPSAAQQATQEATQADHKRMLALLGITEIRRGVEGRNQQSPNFANYDEAKVAPYPPLPELMVTKAGKRVTSAKDWWNVRRPELVELFDREVYGRMPKVTPKVSWTVTNTTEETVGGVAMVKKELLGKVGQQRLPGDRGEHRSGALDAEGRQGPGARRPGVRIRRSPAAAAPHTSEPAGGADLAGAGGRQGLGLRQHPPGEHPGRQRRRAHAGHHRPRQQGPAAQGRRLGSPEGLDVGHQPPARLPRDRQGRGREARRARGAFPLRQGDDRRDGLRTAARRRVRQLVRARAARRSSAAPTASCSRTSPRRASITGWRATSSSTPVR